LCPWLPNASLNHDSPVLIFSGENDPTAPPAEHADIHYNVTPNTTDKLLFEVANGNHSVANSPTGGDDAVGKIALSWLKLYVDDNDCYCPLLTEELLVNPPAASKVLSSFECELVLGVAENTVDISLYPNPTQDFVYINVSKVTYYEVYSALGQRLLSGKLTQGEKQIDF
ncbi:MAG TPA: lipase, partial [Aequorivita sp.]|nr:lipase [Aequorivita sp.]